jgi:hypothetical protein
VVFDHIPLEQYGHGGVGAKDHVPVKAEELGYV